MSLKNRTGCKNANSNNSKGIITIYKGVIHACRKFLRICSDKVDADFQFLGYLKDQETLISQRYIEQLKFYDMKVLC